MIISFANNLSRADPYIIMTRKSIHPNINLEKIYMKMEDFKGTTIGIPLNKEEAIKLSRELLEAVEKAKNSPIELTLYPKRKTPTITITWLER